MTFKKKQDQQKKCKKFYYKFINLNPILTAENKTRGTIQDSPSSKTHIFYFSMRCVHQKNTKNPQYIKKNE
jgi:hypothetical protein